MKLPRPITLVNAMLLAVVSFTSYLLPIDAQSANQVDKPSKVRVPLRSRKPLRQQQQVKQQELDFSGYGRPGRRAGGGSRSPCPPIDPPVTALMPATNWGKTVASHPTFWFYVPYSPQEAPAGEFVLQEEKGKDVYRIPFTLPKTPGFVSFSTPSTAAPLEVDKSYHWYFKLYCDAQKSSTPIFVEGWVQRVALTPELESQLKAAKQQEYVVYAANGIWYDALDHLAQMRLTNPANARFAQEWASLLGVKGVGLEQFSKMPMVGSIVPDQRIGVN